MTAPLPDMSGEIAAARAVSVLPRLGSVCTVRDGRFVEPCAGAAAEPFVLVQVLDPRTRAPERSLVAVWTRGALVPCRWCPACGVEMPGGAA